ncbi:MAG: LuxR C-terminal-related transcriptional regulator, partial [Alphaproteobacteria bacterium]|nr:LuxR C-terminal-related transcriptional regulator [Alphaproteobacteria bacterium]
LLKSADDSADNSADKTTDKTTDKNAGKNDDLVIGSDSQAAIMTNAANSDAALPDETRHNSEITAQSSDDAISSVAMPVAMPAAASPEKIIRVLHLDSEEFFRRGFSQGLNKRLLIQSKSDATKPPMLVLKPDITSVENLGEADRMLETISDFALMVVEPRPFIEQIFHRLREWRLRHPDMKLVVLSNINDRAIILTAIDAGIHGFIPKNFTGAEICAAIEGVVSDKIFLPKTLADVGRKKVMSYPEFAKIRPQSEAKKSLESLSEKMAKTTENKLEEHEENSAELPESIQPAPREQTAEQPGVKSANLREIIAETKLTEAVAGQLPDHYAEQLHGFTQLTPKQRDILLRLISGRSAGEIAQELNMADATIQVHISAIMRFLGARQDYRHQQQGQQQQDTAQFRPENIKRA